MRDALQAKATAPFSGSPDPASLYESELDFVWNVLRKLGVPSADLEDLCHEVFAVAIERLPSYDPSRPLRPWLYGVAFRVVVGARRRWRVPGDAEAADEAADSARDPEAQAVAAEDRKLVWRALDWLAIERRAVFVMHDLEGYSMPEIAEQLGVGLNTAYSRLRLARQDFATAARRLGASGGDHV